jgi:hypothetical protein
MNRSRTITAAIACATLFLSTSGVSQAQTSTQPTGQRSGQAQEGGRAGGGRGGRQGAGSKSCDMAMDAKGDIYVSDGVNGSVTELIAPKNQKN